MFKLIPEFDFEDLWYAALLSPTCLNNLFAVSKTKYKKIHNAFTYHIYQSFTLEVWILRKYNGKRRWRWLNNGVPYPCWEQALEVFSIFHWF